MQRKVILILGKVGSGKSTLAKRIIRGYSRVIVFDTLEEYHNGIVLHSFDEFLRFFREETPQDFFCVLRFRGYSKDDTLRQYEYAARCVEVIGNCLLVLEECERFINSYDQDGSLNDLISFGRHQQVSILAIGRRPTEIPIDMRAAFTSVISFRQTEPNDLRYLESWEFDSQVLYNLPQFQYAIAGKHDTIENIENPQGAILPQPIPVSM